MQHGLQLVSSGPSEKEAVRPRGLVYENVVRSVLELTL